MRCSVKPARRWTPNAPNGQSNWPIQLSVLWGLFAGREEVKGKKVAGLQALANFLEANAPEAERACAGVMFVGILNGTLRLPALTVWAWSSTPVIFGHPNIEQHHTPTCDGLGSNIGMSTVVGADFEASRLQNHLQRAANVCIVIDDFDQGLVRHVSLK